MVAQRAISPELWELDADGSPAAISTATQSSRKRVFSEASVFWHRALVQDLADLMPSGHELALPQSLYRGGDFEEDNGGLERVRYVEYEETDDDIGW